MKHAWVALLVAGVANAQSPRVTRDTQTVVFVCEHGTVKSVIAMAYFDRLADSVLDHPEFKGRVAWATVAHAPPLKVERTRQARRDRPVP